MGKKIRRLIIYGAGGLGNQLFQLAAGYSIRGDREIFFEMGFSGTRKPLFTNKFLDSLHLKDDVKVMYSRKLRTLTQVLLSYFLRVSTKTTGFESSGLSRLISSIVGSIYFSLYYKCFLVMTISKGVGFHKLSNHKYNQMIVGYFQSYRYLEEKDNSKFLDILALREDGPDLIHWSNRAIEDRPLVVHIRLGDYLQENDFGIITTRYISESLKNLSSQDDRRPIWVFTDQRDLAREIFPTDYHSRAVWVPEIDSDPFSTLLVMRLGSGYAVANSTFSWWAARSKATENAPVCYPNPWFSGLETPLDLIPKDWIPIASYLRESK